MKPVIFIGSIALAVAAGAAATYFLVILNGPPGNGAVVCPGSGACPNEARAGKPFGFALKRELLEPQNGRPAKVVLCDGVSTSAPCSAGFAGYLVQESEWTWDIETCMPGQGNCKADHGAIYCAAPGNPTKACAVIPRK